MNRDHLSVENLRLRSHLGTKQWEKMTQQDVIITFSVVTDLSKPAKSDLLEDTVNLGSLVTQVRRYVESASHELVESLALEVVRVLLTEFPIQSATVTVRKPGAFRDADCEAVTLTRERDAFIAAT